MKKQASYKCEGNRETKREKIIIKLYNKMVWLDGFTQLHLFHGLLDSEILRGILLQQEILDFLRFSFTNTNDSYDRVQRHCKRKGPAGEVGSSSYTKPNVYFYSNFPDCLLHSCVEQKTVWLLVTLTVSGSFIIKLLTCISSPLFRRWSNFMFMVPSRYFLSRRRAENVCCEVSNGMHS